MSSLGQKRSFVPGESNVCFAPIADIRLRHALRSQDAAADRRPSNNWPLVQWIASELGYQNLHHIPRHLLEGAMGLKNRSSVCFWRFVSAFRRVAELLEGPYCTADFDHAPASGEMFIIGQLYWRETRP
jgi:hypothetical protein